VTRLRPLDTPYLPESRWTVVDVVLALLAGFVAVAVLGSLFFIVTGIEDTGFAVLVVSLPVQAAATLATLALLGRRHAGVRFPAQVGLAWRWGDAAWIAAGLVLQFLVAVVVGSLLNLLPGEPSQQQVVEVASEVPRDWVLVVVFALLVVVAPVVEEIVYRGVLLSRLRRSMGPWPAILVAAGAFAAIHLVDPAAVYAVPGLFLIGVALGWLALSTGDLGVPIAVHAGVNLTAVVLLTFAEDIAGAGGGMVTAVLDVLPG
jgi:membrane protease YdiL (CAAX protease family)